MDREYFNNRRYLKRQELYDYLGGKCIYCGSRNNLHFDHIDPSTKEFRIAIRIDSPFADLKPELDKCQLLCDRCHKKKTLFNEEFGKLSPHGTIWRYKKYKCRCDKCREAMSQYNKIKRIQKLKEIKNFLVQEEFLIKKSKQNETPIDDREFSWEELERAIQNLSSKKDPDFILDGPWKKFTRMQKGLKIYAVDGNWVRFNLSRIFRHGGHPLVHEFIPFGEIWIGTKHFKMKNSSTGQLDCCGCKSHDNNDPNRSVSPEFFNSTVHHEIVEFYEMLSHNTEYWKAHHLALDSEKKLGLLEHPDRKEDEPKKD